MRRPFRFWLSSLSISTAFALAPVLAQAQTPEPAAGNPAINSTPAPGGTQAPMASPSSEAQIPKGSNPEGGSGNTAAGSGATPSSQASEGNTSSSMMPQTASKPESSSDSGAMGSNTNGSKAPTDTMPTGKYASPPDLAPAPSPAQSPNQQPQNQ